MMSFIVQIRGIAISDHVSCINAVVCNCWLMKVLSSLSLQRFVSSFTCLFC